jgi:uncharacterized membrane protein
MRSSFARSFGRVMPFWMTGSTLLNLLLVFLFAFKRNCMRLAGTALGIQILALVFSLVGPVPFNNRIAKWTPESVPDDWMAQERRWDMYHRIRTCALLMAFALLALGVGLN